MQIGEAAATRPGGSRHESKARFSFLIRAHRHCCRQFNGSSVHWQNGSARLHAREPSAVTGAPRLPRPNSWLSGYRGSGQRPGTTRRVAVAHYCNFTSA